MLLFLDACVRGSESRTKELCDHFFEELNDDAAADVQTVDLADAMFMPLDKARLKKREELSDAGKFEDAMFAAARQFSEADKVVIGAPFWDNFFPAVLKNYLEQICVPKLNFCYTAVGPKPLCKPKKVLYICTSGGKQVMENLGYAYIQSIMSVFFGSEDTAYVSAEMLDVYGVNVEKQMTAAKQKLSLIAKTF